MTLIEPLLARMHYATCHEAADALESLEQQVAALTKERNALQDKLNAVVTVGIREREQLVAAQAREAKLRDAAKAVLEVGMGSDFEALNAALALPTDDSALIERLKKAEPVATKLPTQAFSCFHVSAEDFGKLKALPDGTALYTHPAPSPVGDVVITTTESGECVAVTRRDDGGRTLKVLWKKEKS